MAAKRSSGRRSVKHWKTWLKLRGVHRRTQRNLLDALQAMRPPPTYNVHEWAEARRILPAGSPEPGRWRSKPYQRPVLERIGQPGVRAVVFVAASQGGGKTEILLNAMGYYADADPSPQILVTYSLDMAEKLSKHRVSRMIQATLTLREKIADSRSRDSNNTIRDKVYPGGELTLVGANSAGGLSMHPKRVLLCDELDRWPASAGAEGDPLSLAEARTTAYWNAVKVIASSPGSREGSRLHDLWEESDRNEWHVPCPHCERRQPLEWRHVSWEKDEEGEPRPETAYYACPHCGAQWSDVERWKASAQGGFEPGAEFQGVYGARVNGLAVLGRLLEDMVRQWYRAQGDPERLKAFINTVLAEWWDERQITKGIDETGLLPRREAYPHRDGKPLVPAPVALLTAGVDVQDNRLEVVAWAWAHREESWRLEKKILFGDPSSIAVWEDLDRYLLAPWPRAAGGVDFIRGVCVDTGGHHTQAAYDFCGPRFRRVTPDGGRAFVFAIKGTKGGGEVWPREASKVTAKVPVWMIRPSPAKQQIYGRFNIVEPGPGYIHLGTDLTESDAASLVAERLKPKTNRATGFVENVWILPGGRRNEELDCAVYAYAALCGLRAMGYDLEDAVRELPSRVVIQEGQLVSMAVAPEKPQGASRQPQAPSGWLGDTSGWLRR